MQFFRRAKWVCLIGMLVLSLFLSACEQSTDKKPSQADSGKDTGTTTSAAAPQAKPATAPAPAAVSKVPASIPFEVLDIGERSFENAPALAVLFSHPMDPARRYDDFLHVADKDGPVKGAWVLAENRRVLYFPHIKPQTRYTVTVDAGLDSADGMRLGGSSNKSVTTRKITPVVSFLSQGLLLPKDISDGLPVVTVNVPEVDIEFFRLQPGRLHQFSRSFTGSDNANFYQLDQLKKVADLVYAGRFALNPPANTRTVMHIPVGDIDALKAPGMYFAVMRRPGSYDYSYNTTYFFISDIGVQARLYAHSAVVITASLKTGKPLPDVRVSIRDNKGREVSSGRTDAHGELRLDQSLQGKNLLVAERDKDIAFLPLNTPALDLSGFDLGKHQYKARAIFAYSPRDIYRSGETVTVAALLRDHDGRPIPATPLQARLIRPDHREAQRFVWQPEPLAGVNYYQTRIPLGEDAPTGQWQLEIRTDPASKAPDQVFRFQVEDFVPERMKLGLDVGTGPLQPDAPFVVEVQGDYLYGAPAAGNRLEATLVTRNATKLLKNRPEFVFGDAVTEAPASTRSLEPVMLDKTGHAQITLDPQWRDTKRPLQLLYTASLFETGGRPVTRSVSRQVWPAAALVGVHPLQKPDQNYFDRGTVGFEVIKAKPDGTQVALKGLQVKLIREDRDYYWEYSDQEGWHYAYSQSNYPVAQQDLDLASDKPARLAFDLDYGHYLLELLDPETGLTTRTEFRVGWWSWQQGSGSTRPDQVTLRLDKAAYDANDTAKLTIVPPHDGQAVVMVEGGGLLWSTRLAVSTKGTEVNIPIDPAWDRHDLYISTVVFRPGDARGKITPNRAIGLLPLRLNREPRHLSVELTAPEVTEPLKPVSVDLQVSGLEPAVTKPAAETGMSTTTQAAPNEGMMGDQAVTADSVPAPRHAPVYVTVAAVDVGILSLTDFKTPDPFVAFFGQRRYGADIYDLYGKVIELGDGAKAKLRFGGDADVANAGQRARSRLQFVTLFSGPVSVDDNGHARIRFDMPEFNGKVRLMAVAFSGRRFGSSEREMIVRTPLVTQLSMPRFLAGGDRSVFTLDLNNLSGHDEHLDLQLSVDAPLSLEDGERSLDLANGEKKTLRFAVSAAQALATANVRLNVQGRDLQVQRHWQLDVRPPYPGETRRVGTSIAPGAAFTMDTGVLNGLSPSTIQAYLDISSTPPLDLAKNLRDLLHYPYGCLEQTTSSTYPWLFASPEMVRRFGLDAKLAERRAESVARGIRRIADKQLPSGGFGLWSNHSPEEPWLTPYAVNFLLDARDQGFAVPETMLNRALTRLQYYLQRGVNPSLVAQYRQHRNYARFASTAYAAYLLARVNRAPLGTLRVLFERERKSADAALPLLHLGLALQLAGDPQRAQVALQEGLDKIDAKRDAYYYGDYGSQVRDLALAIYLLRTHHIDLPGRERLVFKLADALQQRRWLSTQERNALFMAGIALAQGGGKTFTGTLVIGDQRQPVAATDHLTLRPDLAALRAGVRFESAAGQPLYVKLAVSGYPTQRPAPVADPIRIERSYYTVDGKPLGERPVKVGDLLLVHVRVGVKRYIPDALVEDLLPAGLEPESQGLKHSVKIDDLVINGKSIKDLLTRDKVAHEEYRDDRYTAAVSIDSWRDTQLLYLVRAVTPGVYKVPAPQVESMYRPEYRGIGAAQETLTVLP